MEVMKIKKEQRTGFFGYFKTPSGRHLTFIAAGATTCGLFIVNFLPHSFGLDYYRDFVQSYGTTGVNPVPEKVTKRIEVVLDKLNISAFERKYLKPFTVFGLDVFHAGSLKSQFGGLLGIPENFGYNSKRDIKRQDMRVRNKGIDWNSDNGQLLEYALVYKEDEQLFAIAREVLYLRTQQPLLNALYPSIAFFAVYTAGNVLNQRFNLLARPARFRLFMYGILGLFGLGTWSFLTDFTQVRYDINISKQLAELGPDYVQAGLNYYDKILKRNIALHNLLGDKTYTALGNENYLIRQKSLPLTIRKQYFEEKLRELKGTAEPVVDV